MQKFLRSARVNKNDEFYTLMSDIEKELSHYKKLFKDKIIYCNCDNCYTSNFVKYFINNFEELGIKRFISTCYDPNYAVDLFSVCEENKAYVLDIDSSFNWQAEVKHLNGNGDFRSQECLEYLKQADIVIGNPPFSLFIEFISYMIKYDKKFLVLGNTNSITYKELFLQIKANKIWLGYNAHKNMVFQLPNEYEKWDEKITKEKNDGHKYGKVPGVSWFTNLEIDWKRELVCSCKYSKDKYPKYDNYDAININKVSEIPYDYYGLMGVPITFLTKYNPEQFEIIGHEHDLLGNDGEGIPEHQFEVNGAAIYKRLLIKRK